MTNLNGFKKFSCIIVRNYCLLHISNMNVADFMTYKQLNVAVLRYMVDREELNR